jgi:hypothetical protein
MTADEVYVDPSALVRLYLHQAGSREMALWRGKLQGPLVVTHHGRTEAGCSKPSCGIKRAAHAETGYSFVRRAACGLRA